MQTGILTILAGMSKQFCAHLNHSTADSVIGHGDKVGEGHRIPALFVARKLLNFTVHSVEDFKAP